MCRLQEAHESFLEITHIKEVQRAFELADQDARELAPTFQLYGGRTGECSRRSAAPWLVQLSDHRGGAMIFGSETPEWLPRPVRRAGDWLLAPLKIAPGCE